MKWNKRILTGLFVVLAVGSARAQTAPAENAPLLDLDLNPASNLSWESGVFGYTFGSQGWPDGVSPLGRNPAKVGLRAGALSFDDLFTGRPRFDLLPTTWLSSLSLNEQGDVTGRFDSLNTPVPLTAIRYQSAGNGSQAVRSLHVQNRSFQIDSTTTHYLQTAFGYAGEGGRGEYDGMRLRRAREISARIRYITPRYSFEVFEVASRRSVGAHTGVIPFSGATYESIYQRLGAQVGDEDARRRTLRNDLTVKASSTWSDWQLSTAPFWTLQTLDFKGETTSLKGVLQRIGLDVSAGRMFSGQQATFTLRSWNDDVVRGSAFDGSSNQAASFTTAKVHLSGSRPLFSYSLSAGPESGRGNSTFGLSASASVDQAPFSAGISFSRSPRFYTMHEAIGFGSVMLRSAFDVNPIFQDASLRAGVRFDLFSIEATGFVQSNSDLLVNRLGTDATLAAVEYLPGSSRSTGVSLNIGFRDLSKRGLWARINAVSRSVRTDDTSNAARAWSASMPDFWASGFFGIRALLFSEDLDLNAYIRARYWGEMGGLRLHTPTGLLALPANLDSQVPADWLVDFVVEAGVREATIFVAYENATSGTTMQIGNLIVPDYPLPRQRTRFGVYWPIAN